MMLVRMRFVAKLACVKRMQIQRQHLCWLYILLWHAGFLEAPGLYEGPGVLRLSFVKEPRGPRRGWLEHTWQFEPLGCSAGITPNWLWRLAVSRRLEMVCCCALCIGWGLIAIGGGKDSSGTSEVDDKVKDLGMQIKRKKGAREMYN